MNEEVLWIVTVERRRIGSDRPDARVRAQKAFSPRLVQKAIAVTLEEQLSVGARIAYHEVLKHTAEAI